ncbi:hypothetical protein HPB47_014195 [Ixodes persulcatus]|uniref:Uncharacterized protein n=1 Tax=Ixodes persulcatus TaxID=34615 RepID=A0AC60QZ65_IXOPE|nr:hypothetical protein HPB47_014195 [Ixodes persulcatus]
MFLGEEEHGVAERMEMMSNYTKQDDTGGILEEPTYVHASSLEQRMILENRGSSGNAAIFFPTAVSCNKEQFCITLTEARMRNRSAYLKCFLLLQCPQLMQADQRFHEVLQQSEGNREGRSLLTC